MHQEFNAAKNVYLDRDQHGIVRQVLHLDAPFESTAFTPQLAAADYLEKFADILGIEAAQLANLGLPPDKRPTDALVEYRFLAEKQQEDTATVAYQQTALGLPVWEAGLAVQLRLEPFRVISSQSTQHPDLDVKRPSASALKRAESLREEELAQRLGVSNRLADKKGGLRKALTIERKEFVVYRFEHANIFRDRPPTHREDHPEVIHEQPGGQEGPSGPTLPLPPVPDNLVEGRHYVSLKVDFELDLAPSGRLHWVAILEIETLAVVYLRPFVDDVSGLVFEIDPMATAGGPLPTATSAALNPVRVSRTLNGLNPPVSGTQSLAGDTVTLSDAESPTIAAPTEPTGTNFDFDARTDGFAAVNAYYHCDQFFRLVDSMGFTRAGYFGGTAFPTAVDHRGAINTTTGLEVNAHCVGTTGGAGIGRTTFALADTTDTAHPIGIACDYRVVLHELGGHGVLYNHVSSANFGFSHSAGDSVAAILSDPGTQAPDRFVTFPWVNIGRRHDRLPSGGWGWSGSIGLNPFSVSLDNKGYNNEQILSSTMFRIYRSIGGDSADLPAQRFAARMTVYLILRAIGTLTPPTNPGTAAGFATALMTADQGDWVSENITGGAYSKVIRWAFEKQGLYQAAGTATPNNSAGVPPAVDVYIDDGRAGEYPYQANFWSNTNIWNRVHADGGTTHEPPVVGQTNYAYVKVKNRGTQPATGVIVKAFHADPAAGLSYPNDWIPMTTAQLPASNVAANNAAEVVVGPFHWVPAHVGHECIFMIVSAAGDASNVDNIAAGDSIPEWRLVPNDNNIGQRNVAPVPGGGTSGLTEQFDGLELELKNPLTARARMEVRHTLPPLLVSRGWKLEFVNPGGRSFTLQPDESRKVVTKLLPGKPFDAADVEAAEERTIHVLGYASGMLIGGLSYELDPKLKHPPRPERSDGDRDRCAATAKALVECLDISPNDVRRVRVRKVTVDIEFDDDR